MDSSKPPIRSDAAVAYIPLIVLDSENGKWTRNVGHTWTTNYDSSRSMIPTADSASPAIATGRSMSSPHVACVLAFPACARCDRSRIRTARCRSAIHPRWTVRQLAKSTSCGDPATEFDRPRLRHPWQEGAYVRSGISADCVRPFVVISAPEQILLSNAFNVADRQRTNAMSKQRVSNRVEVTRVSRRRSADCGSRPEHDRGAESRERGGVHCRRQAPTPVRATPEEPRDRRRGSTDESNWSA